MLLVLVGKRASGEELKWGDISVEELRSLASTPALFGGERRFFLVNTLYEERGEEMLKLSDALAESLHTFVLQEDKLLKKETQILERAGATIEVKVTARKERGFDPFGLTIALAKRDKKRLWLGLMQAFSAGEKPEAVAGLLHWKVRDMRSGRGGGSYSRAELDHLSRTLVFLYHDSHRGGGDLNLLLERFALTL